MPCSSPAPPFLVFQFGKFILTYPPVHRYFSQLCQDYWWNLSMHSLSTTVLLPCPQNLIWFFLIVSVFLLKVLRWLTYFSISCLENLFCSYFQYSVICFNICAVFKSNHVDFFVYWQYIFFMISDWFILLLMLKLGHIV